jgi:hypothetical protein
VRGLTRRRARHEERELAAVMACGTCVLGATTGPLDGRALTHGVDARAGEGAGSSAAALHRATMSGSSLFHAVSKFFWWRNGEGEGKEGACCWFLAGRRRSPLPARPPAAGKKQAGRRRSCVELRVGGGE